MGLSAPAGRGGGLGNSHEGVPSEGSVGMAPRRRLRRLSLAISYSSGFPDEARDGYPPLTAMIHQSALKLYGAARFHV